jgi:hypothetical protein
MEVKIMKLKGRLLFKGWYNRPWILLTEGNIEVDLWPIIDGFLTSIDGKKVCEKQERNGCMLLVNYQSDYEFKYERDELIILKKTNGFGMKNMLAYLEEVLIWLSGRMIEIEIVNEMVMKISADTSEKVFGVYFSHGNSCEIPKGAEKTICKVGEKSDCCVFVTRSSSGFECEKFYGPAARVFLDRLAKGDICATRIGSCEILGRKEDK